LNGPGRAKLRTKHAPFTEITVDDLLCNWINFELAEGTSIDAILTIIVFVGVPQTSLLVYHYEAEVFVSQDGIFGTGCTARSFLALTANEEFG